MAWHELPGFFDFELLYRQALDAAPQGAEFVEVGVYMGRSLAFLAREAIDRGRDDVSIVGVDSFVGLGNSVLDYAHRTIYGSIERACREQMRIYAPEELARITLDVSSSVEASKRHSPWFCFIDAAHDYENVRADIAAWEPVTTGAIAGHDYDVPDVKRAVDEAFGSLVQIYRTSWFVSLRAKREQHV